MVSSDMSAITAGQRGVKLWKVLDSKDYNRKVGKNDDAVLVNFDGSCGYFLCSHLALVQVNITDVMLGFHCLYGENQRFDFITMPNYLPSTQWNYFDKSYLEAGRLNLST